MAEKGQLPRWQRRMLLVSGACLTAVGAVPLLLGLKEFGEGESRQAAATSYCYDLAIAAAVSQQTIVCHPPDPGGGEETAAGLSLTFDGLVLAGLGIGSILISRRQKPPYREYVPEPLTKQTIESTILLFSGWELEELDASTGTLLVAGRQPQGPIRHEPRLRGGNG